MGKPTGAASPLRTVSWLIDWFLKNDVKMQSPVARKERDRLLRKFCAFKTSDGRLLGACSIEQLLGADLVEWLNSGAPKAQWTRRRWCSTVKRPFNEAARLGLIGHSPLQRVSERRGDRGRDLTWDEYRALLRLATPEMRRVLLFLRWSGCRPGELREMEWSQVNFALRQIVKRKHKTVHATKDGEARVIPLCARLVRLLTWLKRRGAHGRWVFVNRFKGPWTTDALCKHIRKIRAKVGLPSDVKLYGCRHAWCTGAIIAGVDLPTVAEIAGHKSILTTQTYIHVAGKKDHIKQAVEKAVQFEGAKAPAGTDAAKLLEMVQQFLLNR